MRAVAARGPGARPGGTIEVRSPWDGRLLGEVPAMSPRQVDEAVSVALDRHRGPQLPAHRRAAVLDRVADLLVERREPFAASISAESGKPITTARGEAARAVDTVRFSAAVARTLSGEVVPLDASSAGEGKVGFVRRVPVGVVGAITPFNFPLNLVCHKVAPAVAVGCPVVLKPAPATPLTALALAEVFEEAGLPPGWLNVVTCTNEVAPALTTHPGVAMLTFTGSPEVGHGLRAAAPTKRVSLELGNNAPVIVEPDSDWRSAAAKVAVAGYSFSGQTCISVQRLFVHRSIHDLFVAELAGRVSRLRVGDPADEATEVSSLITAAAAERVAEWVAEALADGATAAWGGTLQDHAVVTPCVLTGVTPDMRVSHAEVFGPVVGVQAYDHFDEALALANDTRYGLQAGVFTTDLAKALLAAEVLDFGGVLVNEVPTWRADQMPYGGVRDSGNTREGPLYAAQEMTERRLIVLSA
ncbi:MAG TPA: aldehyde dehydrogenase family protein [Acidimicrobiia bacterium]|nr:aldehyde dehydrogenase family protein [Acidimicrobiia bacterium]